jgi:HlyD family secretion protein
MPNPSSPSKLQESADQMKTIMELPSAPDAHKEVVLNDPTKRRQGSLKFSRKGIVIAVAVLLVVAAGLVIANSSKSGQKEQQAAGADSSRKPVLTVSTTLPVMKSMQNVLTVHGTISAWDPISVGASASGLEVKEIKVEEGAIVKKGDVLAVLDSAQLRAQLDSEKARLASAVANVSKSIQPNRPEDISGIQAAVAQAKANVRDAEAALVQAQENMKNAATNVGRYRDLKDSGVVSVQEFENRETTAKVNEANVRSAQERVSAAMFALKQTTEKMNMAQIGGRKEDIDMARASVAEIKGNVKRLQTQLDETFVKAPSDGLIARRDGHLGDISAVGKVMFMMARDNRLELRAQLPEGDLKSVKPGEIVAVDSAYTGKGKVAGRVREISPLIDADTRLATVRIDVPAQSGLKAGMYAEGHINVGKFLALTVPAQAIISRDEKSTLFILHGDQVESRQVTIGNRNSDFVQISSGLNANDQIVLDGGGFLKDGDYVAIASGTTASTPTSSSTPNSSSVPASSSTPPSSTTGVTK